MQFAPSANCCSPRRCRRRVSVCHSIVGPSAGGPSLFTPVHLSTSFAPSCQFAVIAVLCSSSVLPSSFFFVRRPCRFMAMWNTTLVLRQRPTTVTQPLLFQVRIQISTVISQPSYRRGRDGRGARPASGLSIVHLNAPPTEGY